ncbi:hypothetical protein EON83_30430 [bacterium]|nr:MAG: hypothetical protein EON83_30430 [bacterium]
MNTAVRSNNCSYAIRLIFNNEGGRPSSSALTTGIPLPVASTATLKPDARTSTLLTCAFVFSAPHPATNVVRT